MKIIVDINSLCVDEGQEAIAAAMRASVTDGTGNVVASIETTGVSAALDVAADGNYVARVQRIDATGAALGDAMSCEFAAFGFGPFTVYSDSGVNVTILT